MIWLVPIVVLIITIYFAQQAVHAQTNRSNTVKKSLNNTESDTQNTTQNNTENAPDNLTAQESETAIPDSSHRTVQASTDNTTERSQPPSHLTKNDVKPHEAPSLLFANNTAAAVEHEGDDEYDEVEDIGDITMDISEMLKELNLRDTDSPRLDIDTNEYSQLKTGQPGDVQPEKIVNVAGKLRKMLH